MTPTVFLLFLFNVRGAVLDPTARPVEGAKVACGAETVLTDSHGQFELTTANDCDATVSMAGFAAKTIHIAESSDNQITLALAPTSDRVVVTATGAPVPIVEAGVAASVFTRQDFEDRQYPFLQDVLRDVPGLSVVQTGRSGGITSVFARGGDSDTALVLVDGVPVTDPGGALDFAHLTSSGIDRMEVVRGPESALFGAEASSAVIQIFTHHGDPETGWPHGSVSYERGSFSTDHWIASLDGGLTHRLDYALTADQFRTTGEGVNDAYRITTGTANLGYHFSDKTVLRAVFREFDSYTGVPGQVYYGLTDYTATETARDAVLSLRLDDTRSSRFVQHASFGYHRYSYMDIDNGNGGPYNIAALIRTVPGPNPLYYLVALVNPATTVAPPGTTLVDQTVSLFPYSSLTATDRMDGQYQGTFTHRGGALVFGDDFERQAGVISQTNVARYENGVFVNEQYALTPRIFLNGGARLQYSNIFGTEFTPRGAVTFRLPKDVFFRLGAALGIQEPSLLENFARETFFVGNPSLTPETTRSYEAGLSREWFGRRLRLDASLFRNSFSNLIEFNAAVNPGTWQNINQSWARGVEVSGTVRVTRYLSVLGAYTKLYTRITQSTLGDLGYWLPRRPLNSGTIGLQLTPRRWTLIAGARLVGVREDNDFVFGVNVNPGYQFVYADASWQATRHLAPYFRVENALDQLYQEALGYISLSRSEIGGLRITW